MAEPIDCAHHERVDGICAQCGDCEHDIILNGACYYCGSTDIDAVAVSPKPAAEIVPVARLLRHTSQARPPSPADQTDSAEDVRKPDHGEPD